MKKNPIFWLGLLLAVLALVPGIILYACGNHGLGSVCLAGATVLAVVTIVFTIIAKRRNG